MGRGVAPTKVWQLPAIRAANLGLAGVGNLKVLSTLRRAPPVTSIASSSLFPPFQAFACLVLFPSFMLHPARSHGRALHAIFDPRARLNLASHLGQRTWNGALQLQLQQRRHWSKYAQKLKAELFEDRYAAATALKDTGIFVPRMGKRKKPSAAGGDGSRVNLVNRNLASTMPLPSAATHTQPPIAAFSHASKTSSADP